MSPQERNDAVVKALNHPLRRKILRYMADKNGETLSPATLSKALGEPIGNVSYHVRLLVEPGILKLVATAPRRGAVEHFYTRSGDALDKKVTEMLTHLKKD